MLFSTAEQQRHPNLQSLAVNNTGPARISNIVLDSAQNVRHDSGGSEAVYRQRTRLIETDIKYRHFLSL